MCYREAFTDVSREKWFEKCSCVLLCEMKNEYISWQLSLTCRIQVCVQDAHTQLLNMQIENTILHRCSQTTRAKLLAITINNWDINVCLWAHLIPLLAQCWASSQNSLFFPCQMMPSHNFIAEHHFIKWILRPVKLASLSLNEAIWWEPLQLNSFKHDWGVN